MEYTVNKLAKLAGVTSRTLRYYDQVGILRPAKVNESGYRIYGEREVRQLQQILFYRELDVELDKIKAIVSAPEFDVAQALMEHRNQLLAKRARLDTLIANVEQSIATLEGRVTMSDKERFAGFKKSLIDENEKKYGKEIRQKYGDETVDKSNAKLQGMSQEEFDRVNNLATEILETLKAAFATGDPAGELAQKAADLHRQWLCSYWSSYSKEAHAGVAQMYVDDPRFTAYYDKEQPGLAAFLRDAVLIYTGVKS
jgi:DNA-binding transcriptional MerR regulator